MFCAIKPPLAVDIHGYCALIVDAAFVVCYQVYAFVFTRFYNTIFPDTDAKKPNATYTNFDNPGAGTRIQ